ncbi:MAG: hypothetical protein U0798_17475 [Gemmataceae bacterium]
MATYPAGNPTLTPQAMSMADAAKLLSRVSGDRITEAMLDADRQAGAPANPDGTFHLVHYTAWLVKQSGEQDGE